MPAFETTKRFLRFCAIGAISAACSLGMLALLVDGAHLNYLVAFMITFLVINCLAYLASRRLAFRTTAVPLGAGLLRYFGVMLFGLVLNTGAMSILVARLHLEPLAAAAILCVLGAPINFLLHGRLTFAHRQRRPA
jgi:putative flippase GtrA